MIKQIIAVLTFTGLLNAGWLATAAENEVTIPVLSPQPETVAGVKKPRFDLGGTWRFNPAPPAEFGKSPALPTGAEWADIQVPGQWTQQGFTVGVSNSAGYCRNFAVPADWKGKRIKLRCDAVYSDATIWVAGKKIGRHLGGFTPFEFDVTDTVKPRQETTIALAVQSAGDADRFASGIKYASHDLGGISRKIYLMVVPEVNIASLHVRTTFDGEFKNAELTVDLVVANNGAEDSTPSSVKLELCNASGKKVGSSAVDVPVIKAGGKTSLSVVMKIKKPLKWDVEHPNLYKLTTVLGSGKTAETVSTRVGFRQVEVRGNQVFINGSVVKMRGVCRHEVHPTRGRSLEGDWWRRDAEMFARGNVNFIRTSHYPPAEEFLDACDEIGLLVESEAPICWAPADADTGIVLNETMEMVEFNRNHPSVVIWSAANESRWGPAFKCSVNMIGKVDPSRPRIFSYGDEDIELISKHYPDFDYAIKVDANKRPVIFDGYCHLNAYNRREQTGDPGLRDVWGLGFSKMWEIMRVHPGCLGGALWAAIDDTFFLPADRTVGYGTWGPIDAWRRAKPEYWHMTKIYSPVRILDEKAEAPAAGDPIRLAVENRSDFANLSEMRFDWKLDKKSGQSKVEAAPGQKGTLVIPAGKGDPAGKQLEITVTGPRGFMVDAYKYRIGGEQVAVPAPLRESGPLALKNDGVTITISWKNYKYTIDAVTGQFRSGKAAGHEIQLSGPCLTLVPMDKEGGGTRMRDKEPVFTPLWGTCIDWKATAVTVTNTESSVTVKVTGAYAEAEGGYELTIDGSGRMTVTWKFTAKKEINPRQTGITFNLHKSCDTLSWRRRGQWNYYPEDHIGRLAGKAKAFPGHPACGLVGPRTQPTWSWSEDQNQYGCNDFRSTKFNIIEAVLSDKRGAGLRAVAAADRHVHAWIDGDSAKMMIADYANDGSEGFFWSTRAIPDKRIAKDGIISGSAQVELIMEN